MRPRAGRLRHKVHLQEKTVAVGEMGGTSNTWATTATVRAAIEPMTGREFTAQSQESAETSVTILIRYGSSWSGIDTTWRVVDANTSRKYKITAVLNKDMENDLLTLMCVEGEADDE
jgi:SPP1 family predicted phage head-tail adaptor